MKAIDLMKAIAVISMVLIHSLEISGWNLTNIDKGAGKAALHIIEFMGGVPCAGVFAFAMGWAAVYNFSSFRKRMWKRFALLVILGFVVNFFETVLPAILDTENFGPMFEASVGIIATDIYFFFALATLWVGLVGMLYTKKPALGIAAGVIIAAAALTANHFLIPETYTTGSPWMDTLMGVIVRENDYSWYPQITWLVFPFAGMAMGLIHKKWGTGAKFITLSAVGGAAAFSVSLFWLKQLGIQPMAINPVGFPLSGYYGMRNLNICNSLGIICLELALAMGIMKLAGDRLHPLLKALSANVMEIYVIQWIILGFLSPGILRITNAWVNIGVALVILAASLILAVLFRRLIKRGRS